LNYFFPDINTINVNFFVTIYNSLSDKNNQFPIHAVFFIWTVY